MKIEQEQTDLAEKNYLSKPPKKFSDKELSGFFRYLLLDLYVTRSSPAGIK